MVETHRHHDELGVGRFAIGDAPPRARIQGRSDRPLDGERDFSCGSLARASITTGFGARDFIFLKSRDRAAIAGTGGLLPGGERAVRWQTRGPRVDARSEGRRVARRRSRGPADPFRNG